MKLARIEHLRCGEPMNWRGGGGYTYVWVPDDMSEETLYALCNRAANAYLDAERESSSATPVAAPGYAPTIHNGTPDDKTVGELRAEWYEQNRAYRAFQESVNKSRKPFAWHLNQVSGGTVVQFWEHRPAGFIETELSWGHNHGVTIEHSPTVMGDFPFSEEEDDV